MLDMFAILLLLLFVLSWVGHACLWTALLNYLFGLPLSKRFLKPWRYVTGLIILTFPLLLWSAHNPNYFDYSSGDDPINGLWGWLVLAYVGVCFLFGVVVFPLITIDRWRMTSPACVVAEQTHTLDLWRELGAELIGNGKLPMLTRLPGNGVFRIDVTDLTLSLPGLPPAWDGLTILVVSDLHFHGTPARPFFDRVIDHLLAGPAPDLVCLIGDYVDTDTHHAWIGPILGRLTATYTKLAILGNHDVHHDPNRIRAELTAAGYVVLGNGWQEITVRGTRGIVIGHEGPWIGSLPDLTSAPPGLFRLCLSHTPDNFYWGQANGVGLMLCGHVHGGGVRVPLIGSIFVPSKYGRRFDQGIFAGGGTVMVVSRGLSGKEPVRFRCNPQVMRVTLRLSPRT